ncbi:MAG: hypothetical protein K5647_09090, partial [Clostridiales bacterium]|nr:hypothetical protein [Clostridiales bacterium]
FCFFCLSAERQHLILELFHLDTDQLFLRVVGRNGGAARARDDAREDRRGDCLPAGSVQK